MKAKASFEHDVIERIHVDGEKVILHDSQEVSPLLESNRIQREYGGKMETPRRSMRKVGTIDLVTWLRLVREGIADDPKRLKRWLNNPDNRYYRTSGGRL